MTDNPELQELLPDDEPAAPDEQLPDQLPETDGDDFALLSEERFDETLNVLETYADADLELPDEEAEASPDEISAVPASDLSEIDEDERLRLPRAQLFRRRLRNQINMLPLALYLLVLGAYLIARQQDVTGLPDLSALAVGGLSVLVLAFTTVFRALLGGRQERGLLLLGLWIWITAGMLFVLVYGIDRQADAQEWWPVLLWSLGATFMFVYPIERTHDIRLIWLGIVTLVAGGVAYAITSDTIDEQTLRNAVDYWPLLLAVAGIGLLPLAFRRRTG